MNKLRAVFTALLLASMLTLAFPSGVLAVGPGEKGDCIGDNIQFIARYEWEWDDESKTTGSYVFDSGWDVITLSPHSVLDMLNDQVGHWDSGAIMINQVVFKDGEVVPDILYDYQPPDSHGDDFDVRPNWGGHTISHIDFCSLSTLITLDSFTAKSGRGAVTLSWKTGAEIDNAGFNLYRSRFADGMRGKANNQLIAARGDAVTGASYSQIDTPGYGLFFYWLEDVDYNGHRTIHGPVQVLVLPNLRRPVYRPSLPNQ